MTKNQIDFVQEKMQEFANTLPPATVVRETERDGVEKLTMSLPVGDGMQIVMTFFKQFTQCSTNYQAHGKSFTFDRLGVSDSFYYDVLDNLHQTFMQQVERAREAQQRLAKSKSFDFGPVKLFVTQERLDEIIGKLKAGKTHQYFPSGFGTGYNFSIKNITNRYDRAKASKELEELVGRKVYVTSFDAD